jgi:hypothetical protein
MHDTDIDAPFDRVTVSAGQSIGQLVEVLPETGVAPIPGAFSASWADRLAEDFGQLLDEALQYSGGTAPRGPNRHYFAVHPERVRGFADLVTHPIVCGVAATMLGADYQFVELAFDVPLPGAVDQPWHRDFPMPPETRSLRRLTSLAFNITTVDVTDDMGPFEVAPGTQFDDDFDFTAGMFPTSTERYEALARRSHPRRGDMSVRSPLTIHHGTANTSTLSRGVLVLGVVAPGEVVGDSGPHDLAITAEGFHRLPPDLRGHLRCRVVDRLEPIVQRHTIEGLLMGR